MNISSYMLGGREVVAVFPGMKITFLALVELFEKISMHCNVAGPSRIHLQPSVHSIRPSPGGTKALNRKRLLTHTDKGKIYGKPCLLRWETK